MSLKERLAEDVKAAMRSGDSLRRDTLRLVQNALKYAEIEKGGPLEASEEIEALRRQAKQRRESIEAFELGGRQAQADQEAAELAILEEYLPTLLGREEVEALARDAIEATGAQGPAEKGKVMGRLMPQLRGKADGTLVNAVVADLLESRAKA
jgi:uncharacterized protein YqeY